EEPAPEFWSAEDKAAWDDVPAELRPVLKKYEQQRVEFVNEKAREAAAVREQARAEVARHAAMVAEAARWWGEAGPALQGAFADKWAQVDWRALADKNPSEWARLNQQRLDEAAMLAEAERRGQADRQAAEQRAAQELAEAREAEHQKLADKLPDFFGTQDAAAKTYDELGRFLLAKGIPVERINAVYEAPIIELALSALRFEQAQQHALRSAERAKQGQSARPTPTRIAPGPSFAKASEGNRQGDAVRQASARFRQSGGSSLDDAAELIRLNDL
ncbi:MAG: hypothetical protein JOY64_21530, partial [Alphaproteobacteria bacterium]|nr:hypothetical protein [Alphaproteobacteria bacterium]